MDRPRSILIVQEDHNTRARIRHCLEDRNLQCWEAKSGSQALHLAEDDPPDLIVLDLDLPHESGLPLCTQLRTHAWLARVPIVALSARAGETDRIQAFEAGVDDFVAKPLFAPELGARVAAILRRATAPPSTQKTTEPLEVGGLQIDWRASTVGIGERMIDLTPMELSILTVLASEAGRVVGRAQIRDTLRDRSNVQSDRTIDAHIKTIRRKLGAARDYIETVRGVGYRLSETGPR